MPKYHVTVHGLGTLSEIYRWEVDAESSMKAANLTVMELTDNVLNPTPHHAWVRATNQSGPGVAELYHFESDARGFRPRLVGNGITRPIA